MKIFLCFATLFAAVCSLQGAPSEADLRRSKTIAETRQIAAEALSEVANLEASLQLSDLTVARLGEEKTELSLNIGHLRKWGLGQWTRAEKAEEQWREEVVAHDKTKVKYFRLKIGACVLLFILVFLVAVRFTQDARNPLVVLGVPALIAAGLTAGAWMFL